MYAFDHTSSKSSKPLRVLMLSHGCQSRTEGQPKAILLGKMPDIDLRVLTPQHWKDYGHWRQPQPPLENSFDFRPTKVRFPWTGPGQSYLHYYPRLATEVADFKPDIINVWEEPWSLVSAHACRIRDRVFPTAKVIVETEQNIFKPLPPPFRQIRHFVLSRADGMVARSGEAVQVLQKLGYVGTTRLVPNAVDTQLFQPAPRNKCIESLIALTGHDWTNQFIVGFVGRMVIEKGIFDLIDAIAQCPSDVVLLAVGSGEDSAKAWQLSRDLKLADRVVVLPALPHHQLPSLLGAMDVLAIPSQTTPRWKEQFGRVIIESHACGIPVIGSASGAIPDVIGDGGRVVPEQNAACLTQAIVELRNDPVLRKRLGAIGLAQVTAHNSWNAIAEQMRIFYHDVTAGDFVRSNRN